MGTDESRINVELMTKLYLVIAHNLNMARKARDKNKPRQIPREADILRIGDNILLRDQTSKVFQLKYKDFCIIGFVGKNQVQVKDNHGHTTKVHRRDVKKIPMTDKISQIFEEEQVNKIRNGRKAVPTERVSDLAWDLTKQEMTHKIREQTAVEEIRIPGRIVETVMRLIFFLMSIVACIQHATISVSHITRETVTHMLRHSEVLRPQS